MTSRDDEIEPALHHHCRTLALRREILRVAISTRNIMASRRVLPGRCSRKTHRAQHDSHRKLKPRQVEPPSAKTARPGRVPSGAGVSPVGDFLQASEAAKFR
jgi:hypothetical protein